MAGNGRPRRHPVNLGFFVLSDGVMLWFFFIYFNVLRILSIVVVAAAVDSSEAP